MRTVPPFLVVLAFAALAAAPVVTADTATQRCHQVSDPVKLDASAPFDCSDVAVAQDLGVHLVGQICSLSFVGSVNMECHNTFPDSDTDPEWETDDACDELILLVDERGNCGMWGD